MYLNSVQIIGFVGKDPERRQARSNGAASWSPIAAASAWATKRSTSALSSPARRSASKKSTTISGWSALWIMIWDISIWRRAFWNRWKFPSAQRCYPRSRYILLPMSPGWTLRKLVDVGGLEPPTPCLQSRCSPS